MTDPDRPQSAPAPEPTATPESTALVPAPDSAVVTTPESPATALMPAPESSTALVPVPEAASVPATTPATPTAVIATAEAESVPGDPFPRQAWSTLLSHAAGYLRLTLALLKDPAVSKHRRAALLAAAAYFASPIDLVPGIIPVLGQLDDLAIAMLAIRLALNALEPSRRQAHLAAAGLSDDTLREDILAAGTIGAWSARAGARTGLRVGRATLRVTARGGRAVAGQMARGGRAAAARLARRGRDDARLADAAPPPTQTSSPSIGDEISDSVGSETSHSWAGPGGRTHARSSVGRASELASGALSSAAGQVGRLTSGGVDRAGSTGRRLAARIRRQRSESDGDRELPSDPS